MGHGSNYHRPHRAQGGWDLRYLTPLSLFPPKAGDVHASLPTEKQRSVAGGQWGPRRGVRAIFPFCLRDRRRAQLTGRLEPCISAFRPAHSLGASGALHQQEVERTQAPGHPSLGVSPFLPQPRDSEQVAQHLQLYFPRLQERDSNTSLKGCRDLDTLYVKKLVPADAQ